MRRPVDHAAARGGRKQGPDAATDVPLLRIPTSVEEVNARWLEAALGVTDPGLKVESAEVTASLGGACTKLRVALRTNRSNFPERVIVKGCLEPHSRGMTAAQSWEVRAYRDVVPRLDGIQTAQIFFAAVDERQEGILVMEDLALRGARCLRAVEPIASFELAARFVDGLASLHARFWDAAELADGGPFAWAPSDTTMIGE